MILWAIFLSFNLGFIIATWLGEKELERLHNRVCKSHSDLWCRLVSAQAQLDALEKTRKAKDENRDPADWWKEEGQ